MKLIRQLISIVCCTLLLLSNSSYKQALTLYKADDPNIHYIGRVSFVNPLAPRFWASGVYVKAKFKGTGCEVLINDEVVYGNYHNYIEIAIDGQTPYRVLLTDKTNTIKIGGALTNGEHIVTICKDTESHIGYLEFAGIRCEQLLPQAAEPERKMEFIGDSITGGTGIDISKGPCNTGQWYDQHNAYMAYGPITARTLNAEWEVTSVSGIGLMHSCCSLNVVMPQVYDKVFFAGDSIKWDFKRYQPDVVTICLGQNDGKQDSVAFCGAYVKFIAEIRGKNPNADIVCLSSPMADATQSAMLKRYIGGVNRYENAHGNKKVYHFFFSRQFSKGCGGHPDLAEHRIIAAELTAYVKQLKKW